MHGHDIATGMGRPSPISAEHATLILGTVCPEMWPLVVRPEAGRGAPVTYEVRLRGNGPRYVIRVADGTAEVRAAGGPVDCVISADPVTYLLVVYGRMPLGRALLRGGMLAWGRRPWLGLRFNDQVRQSVSYLRSPANRSSSTPSGTGPSARSSW